MPVLRPVRNDEVQKASKAKYFQCKFGDKEKLWKILDLTVIDSLKEKHNTVK